MTPVNKKRITTLCRNLRRRQTPAENVLWQLVRNRKLNGYKFLRQYAIEYGNDHRGNILFFIADFYCHEKKLVVELDGKIHDFQKEYDENRTEILKTLGLTVLRIPNEKMNYPEAVLEEILAVISRL